jgi:hypothetical protein
MTDTAAAAPAETQEEAEARGFRGVTFDPVDRDEYTLATGPESPGLEAQLEAKKAEIDAQLEELKARTKERAEGAKAKVQTAHASRQAARESKG